MMRDDVPMGIANRWNDSSLASHYRPWLHRFSLALACLTLLLVCAGGLVTSYDAGLSVPDWPTTYGENMFLYPPSKWTGGILYEHSHRLIASSVGFLTIVLAAWLWKAERRCWLRRLGLVALGLVIVQGLLGGATVLLKLPTAISVAHACLAQTFFCIVVSVAVFTSRGWLEAGRPVEQGPGLDTRRVAVVCTSILFVQLLLGAVMRHTHSGLAVPDFPRAYGQWAPSVDAASVAEYNALRQQRGLSPVEAYQIVLHMLHRGGALLVSLAAAGLVARVLARHRAQPGLSGPAVWLASLMLLQWVLGAATVLTGRAPLVASLHVAVGAAALAASLVVALRAHRCLELNASAGAQVSYAPAAVA